MDYFVILVKGTYNNLPTITLKFTPNKFDATWMDTKHWEIILSLMEIETYSLY